jgi:Ca2+-binding RTX toxin-like protein
MPQTAYVIRPGNSFETKESFSLGVGDTLQIERDAWLTSTSADWATVVSDSFVEAITVSGLLASAGTSAISLNAGGNITVNMGGKISGNGNALELGGTGVDYLIKNHGTIAIAPGSRYGSAIAAVVEGAGTFTLENYGVISYRIYARTSSSTIINKGSISGDIIMGDDDDLYDGRGGLASGIIELALGDDQTFGGIDAETFIGGEGNDSIDGGGGNDIVSFSGVRKDYTLTPNVDGTITVRHKNFGR